MTMRCFLDTNIFLYAVDDKEIEKRRKARAFLIKVKAENEVFVSTQVVQEFVNIATKKLGFQKENLGAMVKSIFTLPIHNNDFENILDAIKISENAKISFWDALIVSAAAPPLLCYRWG